MSCRRSIMSIRCPAIKFLAARYALWKVAQWRPKRLAQHDRNGWHNELRNSHGQPIETFAHIADPTVQMVAVGRTQTKHYASRISWLINCRSAGQLTTTPLG